MDVTGNKAELSSEPSGPSPTLRLARWTYRATSRDLKRRSDDEIWEDKLLRRSLRIGALSFQSLFWGSVLLVAVLGVGIFTTSALTHSRLTFSLLLFACVLILASPLVWLAGRLTLGVALEVRQNTSETQIGSTIAYRDVENVWAERELHEQQLFFRNVEQPFVLQTLEWADVRFFEDGKYEFAPRVNVLLGKNGYGKTLLLRTLAALIQRNREHSGYLFQASSFFKPESKENRPRLVASLKKNNELVKIIRDSTYFLDTVGKIPLLAIPDSRFVNRSIKTVARSTTNSEPLSASGAINYLTQEPYENVVGDFLSQIALDYLEGKRGFRQPIFRLIEDVVRKLTDDDQFAFAKIRRSGQTGFEILVRTAGVREDPVPIQSASQGTFSIVAIFGLIYSFLRSVRGGDSSTDVSATPAIVIIDEVDAHLHPSWQQKIMGILTGKFPNVQFIVSAHSPAIVAGCDLGEVSVLRRSVETDRFRVESVARDFLGVTSAELYKVLFEIDDIDRLYLEYATKATMDDQKPREREIEQLAEKDRRSATEEERLRMLEREDRLVRRATEVRRERLTREESEAYIDQLKGRVATLENELMSLRQQTGTTNRNWSGKA